MRKKRNKRSSAPANPGPPNFPDHGKRTIECPPYGVAKVTWGLSAANIDDLHIEWDWQWNDQPQLYETKPIDGNPLEALTKGLNAIAARSRVPPHVWVSRVFEELGKIEQQALKQTSGIKP